MHISEVAPRWIKNIHEFISEGQSHVLKVHHIDREKNQFDVSIKRVSEEEKKFKLARVRDEKKIKKILEVAISNAKVKLSKEEVREKIEKVLDVYEFFELLGEGEVKLLEELDLPKQLKSELLEIAKKSFKKPIVEVKKIVSFTSYDQNGVEKIKKAFELEENNVQVLYLGAPHYQISLKANSYKDGEKHMKKILDEVEKFAVKNNCSFEMEIEK
ncbi:hypothetical protein HYT84_03885 [Candidatus Micrarchaeota archaeon]|nr:hypothetical protein [Candidatus Micrarchaeota archaeon]